MRLWWQWQGFFSLKSFNSRLYVPSRVFDSFCTCEYSTTFKSVFCDFCQIVALDEILTRTFEVDSMWLSVDACYAWTLNYLFFHFVSPCRCGLFLRLLRIQWVLLFVRIRELWHFDFIHSWHGSILWDQALVANWQYCYTLMSWKE